MKDREDDFDEFLDRLDKSPPKRVFQKFSSGSALSAGYFYVPYIPLYTTELLSTPKPLGSTLFDMIIDEASFMGG